MIKNGDVLYRDDHSGLYTELSKLFDELRLNYVGRNISRMYTEDVERVNNLSNQRLVEITGIKTDFSRHWEERFVVVDIEKAMAWRLSR